MSHNHIANEFKDSPLQQSAFEILVCFLVAVSYVKIISLLLQIFMHIQIKIEYDWESNSMLSMGCCAGSGEDKPWIV